MILRPVREMIYSAKKRSEYNILSHMGAEND